MANSAPLALEAMPWWNRCRKQLDVLAAAGQAIRDEHRRETILSAYAQISASLDWIPESERRFMLVSIGELITLACTQIQEETIHDLGRNTP